MADDTTTTEPKYVIGGTLTLGGHTCTLADAGNDVFDIEGEGALADALGWDCWSESDIDELVADGFVYAAPKADGA